MDISVIATVRNRVNGEIYDTPAVVIRKADDESVEQALQRSATCEYNDLSGRSDDMDQGLCEVFWHDLIGVRYA